MEKIISIHIEKLPEGVYLATSDDLPGLVAQGRTVTETLEIARDVARKITEARAEKSDNVSLKPPNIGSSFDDFLEEEGILEEVNAVAIKRGFKPMPFGMIIA
ncbi:hypothetical protein QUF80_21660 [Desulfococcaceae bacterium HSG8]|nr:hypothetical protein [Desulfococcaceae bacterium HSG8]